MKNSPYLDKPFVPLAVACGPCWLRPRDSPPLPSGYHRDRRRTALGVLARLRVLRTPARDLSPVLAGRLSL
jgi:hypothetical protein